MITAINAQQPAHQNTIHDNFTAIISVIILDPHVFRHAVKY